MVRTIEEVLTELGWDDGFRIPVANEENKRLEEEVERKRKLKASLSSKLETKEELIETIKKNVFHMESQRDHNQNLITAHSAQIEAENNHYKTSQSTLSNLNQEIHKFEKEKKEATERISSVEKDIAKLNDKLKMVQSTIKLDQNRLLQWEKTLQREDKDNELIQQFIKSDAKKFKEYELKRQKLGEELEVYRAGIVKAVDKVSEMEVVLDKTARIYVQALKERRQLINQWTQSVLVLRQRDNAIQESRREIETLREIAKENMEIFQEAEQFLNNQLANNKELEDNIEQLQRKVAMAKEEQRKLSAATDTYETETHIQKKNLEECARQIQNKRASIKRKRIEIENKRVKIKDCRKQIEDLKATLKEISNQKMNIEERTRQLEEMIGKEDKRKSQIMKEMNRFQALILRTANQISEMENEKKMIYLRCQSEKKKIETLGTFRAKIEKLQKAKKTDLYNVELEAQKCEIRLQRLTDVETDKDQLVRKQKAFEDLQKVYNEKMEVSKLLQTQIGHLEHDMRELTQSLANNKELERLRNKKQELNLLIEGGEKQLRIIQASNEEKQVEENLLRLKVNQAEKLTSSIDGKVYNLEKYRLQIEAGMQERMAEIKAQKEALSMQQRVAMSECSELQSILFERKTRIQQLKCRYDASNALIGVNPTDGTPLDTTYLKIQNAQEKYLLQEQGDELDRTIRKCEHEIESMENTLRIVNACNDKYKSSLAPVSDDGPEKAEQKKLEEEMYNVLEKKRQIKAQLEEKQNDLKKMEENYIILEKDIERTKEEKENKERFVANLKKQITQQKEKLLRAEKSLRKAFKDIQSMCVCTDDETILWQEKDIAARELQELNNLALQHIAEFTIRHVEAEAYIKKCLASRNIELPLKYYMRPSPSSSTCGSLAGSTDIRFRCGSRASAMSSSSRESISCIVNFKPQFSNDAVSRRNSSSKSAIQSPKRPSSKTRAKQKCK